MKGTELLALRRKHDWTQRQLAEKLGVQVDAVKNWEHDRRRISEQVAAHIRLLQKEEADK
jgi:DNA-binding transcriptional regulator YiaG